MISYHLRTNVKNFVLFDYSQLILLFKLSLLYHDNLQGSMHLGSYSFCGLRFFKVIVRWFELRFKKQIIQFRLFVDNRQSKFLSVDNLNESIINKLHSCLKLRYSNWLRTADLQNSRYEWDWSLRQRSYTMRTTLSKFLKFKLEILQLTFFQAFDRRYWDSSIWNRQRKVQLEHLCSYMELKALSSI